MPHGISFFKYKSLRCVMDSFLQKKRNETKRMWWDGGGLPNPENKRGVFLKRN
jgi:hypothetical protein